MQTYGIDEIMSMLDWNKSEEEQQKGILFAKRVQNYNVFLQPRNNKNFSKNVWENCAIILSSKADDELSSYMVELMMWLQDLNWPGAICILDRLRAFKNTTLLSHCYCICQKYAIATNDEIWLNNLELIFQQ